MSTARHIDSTNPERVRVMMATGHIKDGQTTIVIPDSDDAFHHIMRLVSLYGRERAKGARIDALLGESTTVDEATRQDDRICDALHHVGVAVRWALTENGRGAEGDPHRTGLTPEGSRKVAERNDHV